MKLDRRTWCSGAAGLALSACAGRSGRASSAPAYGDVPAGVETWSESLMLLYFSERADLGFSVRVSRYPDMNATWLWCHVLHEGRIYSFTERRLPCEPERNLGAAPSARYASSQGGIVMVRRGTVQDLDQIALDAAIEAHADRDGADGAGDTPIALQARFLPDWLKANAPPGRSEWTGRVEARLSIEGRVLTIAGIAKAHEQVQTRPRFAEPYTYAMMWAPSASFIALSSPLRRYGDWESGGRSIAVEELCVAAPAARRRFRLQLAGGTRIETVAHAVASYRTPVFDRLWSGNIVRAELAGVAMVGMINDWRPAEQRFCL